MTTARVLDQLLACLEADQARGRRLVRLAPENREFLARQAARATRATPPAPLSRAATARLRVEASRRPAEPGLPGMGPAPIDVSGCGWDELERLVRDCTRCPLCRLGRTKTVFGAGNRQAELLFIGEGPGEDEDRQGLPFVGVAGQLLDKIIDAMGFRREDVFIANIVKCRPPGNRNPEPLEAEACLPYLRRQLELVKPKIVVLLGAVPLRHLLGRSGIVKHRGQWLKYQDIDVMPTFHPSYLNRKPEAKRDVWLDMQQVMARFGKTPPPRPAPRPSR